MDKLEKHIKETLKDREITPSSNAWEKITSEVSVEKKNGGKRWFPYAIAASVVGIVLVSVFYFNSDSATEEQPMQLVEEQVEEDVIVEDQNELFEVEKSVSVENTVAATDIESPVEKEEVEPQSDQIAIVQPRLDQSINEDAVKDQLEQNRNLLIAQKLDEVVAQVAQMEASQTNVSDAEVDSLLYAAQKQIMADKLFTPNGTVDAMSLLAEVEDELDESFRDQIFDALKTGYFKLRTAVADRNE
ncbi:hypothetical protein [Flagellimonas zhangzhouensis]|uniref:Uncharacterized protein n=1 Tax=Flagellimonas zhangzhouensis TaxID=1073328 RepID=A0A1H2X8D9_9FLAO|nr:hypothetical protein [Allomuricauda zhangzhouensis]SDQ29396.1 hypothetical protein SAMN05216294_1273 [Allomuricauda zhangzhouensis]SDW89153.1 hypothetical protein SAMN04487892_2652 [Allomuricauda zhangzhouensis]